MKTIISFLFAVLISVIFTACTSRSQKCEELLKKNDSVIVNEYLAGFDYEGQVKKAVDRIVAYEISNGLQGSETDENLLLALEKSRGAKDAALFIYETSKYHYRNLDDETASDWNNKITILEKAASSTLAQQLRNVVLEKSDDPLWLKRYMPDDKFLDVCLSKQIKENVLIAFFVSLSESEQKHYVKIVDNISDGWIINYRKYSPFFKSRVIKMAKQATFSDAYEYLTDVNAIPERNLLVKNKGIENLDTQEIIMCAGNQCFPVSKARIMLSKKPTSELANVIYYEFPQEEYLKILVNSIKSYADVELAENTFKNLKLTDREYDFWTDAIRLKYQNYYNVKKRNKEINTNKKEKS